jgi:hypothetical protein
MYWTVRWLGTLVAGINAPGQIVGSSGKPLQGFLRSPNGAVATFGVVSGYNTYGWAVNAGLVTGSYLAPDGNLHGYLRIP